MKIVEYHLKNPVIGEVVKIVEYTDNIHLLVKYKNEENFTYLINDNFDNVNSAKKYFKSNFKQPEQLCWAKQEMFLQVVPYKEHLRLENIGDFLDKYVLPSISFETHNLKRDTDYILEKCEYELKEGRLDNMKMHIERILKILKDFESYEVNPPNK